MSIRLKEIREASGLTQGALAKLIGVDVKTVGNWERGTTNISLEDAIKVASALKCTLNELAGLKPPKPRMQYAAIDLETGEISEVDADDLP